MTNISELLKSLDSSSTSLKSKIIRKLFVILKHNLAKITGNELSNYLEDIKENILSFIGGSLALFDMSRNARTYKKIKTPLSEDLVAEVSDKIDNWVIRLAKD